MTDTYVLFDDQRPGGTARLYRDPIAIVTTDRPDRIRALLDDLRAACRDGLRVAGYLAYGAGAAMEPRLKPAETGGMPLAWFGLYAGWTPIDDMARWLPDPAGAATGPVVPRIERDAYLRAFDTVQARIASGDIYQANLTFPADIAIAGDPLALYARLRRASAGWGGIVHDGARHLLSCSPELFFTLHGDHLTARPMKGTASREKDPIVDARVAAALAVDPKQRAENLMIVDLLRNDLARVARAGSVAVPELFTVESYPTVHQLTSTVTATLSRGGHAADVLATIFPCGSVTGAPKIRAMEIIDEVEPHPRGVYTGSIGWIDPGGDAAFNVAIRTLRIESGTGVATMGLGSGIVADSNGAAEWQECLDKGRFVTAGSRPFDLIETMRFDPHDGLLDLDRHMARLGRSAAVLDFAFDRHDARNELQAATFRLRHGARVRLMLSRSGAIAIEARALPPVPDGPMPVAIRPLPVAPDDFRLSHKTSDRAFYDDARRAAGTFEVLFEDADGHLTEGSFTSLFVPHGDHLLTPAIKGRLLPGILRSRLIAEGRAVEADLTRADLMQGFLIGNAVRGMILARLVS